MSDPAISYRADFGCWWPDYDHAPEKCFGFVQRGLTDMDVAAGLCRRRRTCVQAGAHAGLWPRRLAGLFGHVHAFECEPALHACAVKNLAGVDNVSLYAEGLGAAPGEAMMLPAVSAGSWRIDPLKGRVAVMLTTIDALGLDDCDAIYLDVEGYEVEVLRGAAETIARCRPVLHVEELPRAKAAIQAHMAALDYRLAKRVHGDAVYLPRRA